MSVRTDVRPCRALVIDDHDGERVAIKAAIEDTEPGCDRAEASDLVEAKQLLEQSDPFDVVVLDLRLENDEEGLALLGSDGPIRSRSSLTRIILLTAYPDWKSACLAFEGGADAYLAKTDVGSTKKLQEKLKTLLEETQFRRDVRRQLEAQRKAEEAFEAHRQQWAEQYAGRFLIVQDGQVIATADTPGDLSGQLDGLPTGQRLEVGIVEVPGTRDNDAQG